MQRILETDRLTLRPFELVDASLVQKLAGDREVAQTTLSIPHPYPDGAAEAWIAAGRERASAGHGFPYAIVIRDEGVLIGCISLNLTRPHSRGELAYWLGTSYWGKGYATEAAAMVVNFGFDDLGLNRIWAAAMSKNPASSRVMQKIGMKPEGEFRQHILKWGEFEDLVYYGMTKGDRPRTY